MPKSQKRSFYPIRPFPNDALKAELIAHQYDEHDTSDWMHRRPILNSLPERFSIPIAYKYNSIYEKEGRRSANLFMLDTKDDIKSFALKLSANNDDLINHAVLIAQECAYQRLRYTDSKQALAYLINYVRNRYRVDLSKFNTHNATDNTDTIKEKKAFKRNVTLTTEGMLNRLCDELWWRRTLRNVTIRNIEKYSIDLGLVHRNAGIYISDESLHRRRQQQKRNKRKASHTILENELGDEFTLQELIDTSLANPSNRRNELMVRIRGTEEISKSLGHIGMFYTITCPSKMHARLSKFGEANPKHDGTTPIEAQKYLTKMWAQIRAKLKRMGIDYYGFRVVEPHHDGTPHWHLLLFMVKENISTVNNILREYSMREDPNEKGADEHRFKAVKVNPKKGSATGYIAKYISKNIDGFGVDDDLYGNNAATSAERIVTWASTWGIRQFQQLGSAPVTIYRELRRIEGKGLNGLLLQAWEAADEGNWQTFVQIMGGPLAKRKDLTLSIMRQWNDEPNKYKEPKGFEIIGIEYRNVSIPTRIHKWTVKYKPEPIMTVYKNDKAMGPPLAALNWDYSFYERVRRLAS